jgi:hypothetical protein
MQQVGLPLLSSWQNFYMIAGTAAATLTGLVVIATTLIAGIEKHVPTLNAGISAFNTPTIVHFCAVLLLAAIFSMPWQAFSSLSLLLGLIGLSAVLYLINVIQQIRHIPGYRTPPKDWLWYIAIPLFAYITLIIAAVVLPINPVLALYGISAVMLVLLFIGIHNAWDLVTYLAVERSHPKNESPDQK